MVIKISGHDVCSGCVGSSPVLGPLGSHVWNAGQDCVCSYPSVICSFRRYKDVNFVIRGWSKKIKTIHWLGCCHRRSWVLFKWDTTIVSTILVFLFQQLLNCIRKIFSPSSFCSNFCSGWRTYKRIAYGWYRHGTHWCSNAAVYKYKYPDGYISGSWY